MATEAIELEWCPSCGEGVESLNPFTGFCQKCSLAATDSAICDECGNEFKVGNRKRRTCDKCVNDNIKWLRRNADAIERVMAHDNDTDVVRAIQKVYDDNRPRCAMCGDKLKHGTKGRTIFCGKRDESRRASVRYYIYRKRNGMSDEDALERAIHGKRAS